jgi:prophage tail gpP-like protein
MTGYLTDYKSRVWQLPVLLSWDVSHGMGEPCDAFEVSFLYTADMADMLYGAVRFRAEHGGETVFTGVVDEYEVTADESGLLAVVRGRSLAALLLDNECEAAQYAGAGLDFILRRHVYPWGIKYVRTKRMPAVPSFTVKAGESQWGALREYCWFAGGVEPRFSRDGVLLLNGESGRRFSINQNTAVTSAAYRDDRYGVISQVLVKSRNGGTAGVIANATYSSRGASCRRVLSMPRKTGYDAMRHTGQYQIARSARGKRVCRITLAALFAAFAGDIVALDYPPLGLSGNYKVYESRCWADKDSAGTQLVLEVV